MAFRSTNITQGVYKVVMNGKPEKMNRPSGVPIALVKNIEQRVADSWPCVVDPDLAEEVKKNGSKSTGLIPVPTDLIQFHLAARAKAGASEREMDEELDYIMWVFEQAAKGTKSD